jgi:hypothetical protein
MSTAFWIASSAIDESSTTRRSHDRRSSVSMLPTKATRGQRAKSSRKWLAPAKRFVRGWSSCKGRRLPPSLESEAAIGFVSCCDRENDSRSGACSFV